MFLKGFTLIEGIIAIGIISTALIVGLSLAVSNLTASQANADRVLAGNLAREGIEVMRNIRDSNWLRKSAGIKKDDGSDYSWDDFLATYNCSSSCSTSVGNYADVYLDPIFSFDSNGRIYTLVSGGTDLLPCMAAQSTSCRIQKKTDKASPDRALYFQRDVPYPSDANSTTVFTPYYRRITLQPICWSNSKEFVEDTTNMTCENTGIKIGVLVTSRVLWQKGNKTLEVKAKERLYNWKS